MRKQKLPVLGMLPLSSVGEMWLTKKTESYDGWGASMQSYCSYWSRHNGRLYALKSKQPYTDLSGSMSGALNGLYAWASSLSEMFSFIIAGTRLRRYKGSSLPLGWLAGCWVREEHASPVVCRKSSSC